MSASRGPVRNVVEAALAVGLLGPLLLLPPRATLAGLRAVGRLLFLVARGRRAHARRRVQLTLGLDRERADAVVAGAFANLATNVLEAGCVARLLRQEPLDSLVAIEGGEHLAGALERGEGVLLATAHLGAWEAMGPVLAQAFRPVWAVARPLDNPLLEKLALRLRGEVLAGTFDKHGSALRMARLVKQGEVVALLLDQNAGSAGVMLPFLGLPSRQHRAAGVLGARFGATVICAYMLRGAGDGRYRLVIEPPLRAAAGADPAQAELDLVSAVSRSLERRVLANPEQWNWLHDRWHSAEVTLFLDRQRRASAKSAASLEAVAGTNGA